jgi:hypothetical protein
MIKLKNITLTTLFFISILLLFALPAFGQATGQMERRVEVEAGYSHLNVSEQNIGGLGSIAIRPASLNGYQAGVGFNFNPTIGVVFQQAGYFGRQELVVSPIAILPTSLIANLRTFYYQAGPKLTVYDNGSQKGYVVALFGDVNRNGDDAFAFDVGGGLDHRLNDFCSVRLFQVSYGFNRLGREANLPLQKSVRISTGFVFGK